MTELHIACLDVLLPVAEQSRKNPEMWNFPSPLQKQDKLRMVSSSGLTQNIQKMLILS